MSTSSTAPASERRRKQRSRTGIAIMAQQRRDRLIMQSLLIVMALVWIFPLYSAVKTSLRGGGWGNYSSLLSDPLGGIPLWRTYANSLIIGAIHATIVVVVATTAGYAFGKLKFKGREVLFYASILFLAVPGTAIVVPIYYLTREMGLFNNYFGAGLPEAALTVPFGILLMRNFAANIPDELIEASLVDRASYFDIFRYVYLPLSRPAIVNLVVLCVMWSLQDFLWPSLLYTDPNMTTAAQAVSTFRNGLSQSPTDIGRYNASLVVLAVPAVALVIVGAKFITNGLTSGAVKD